MATQGWAAGLQGLLGGLQAGVESGSRQKQAALEQAAKQRLIQAQEEEGKIKQKQWEAEQPLKQAQLEIERSKIAGSGPAEVSEAGLAAFGNNSPLANVVRGFKKNEAGNYLVPQDIYKTAVGEYIKNAPGLSGLTATNPIVIQTAKRLGVPIESVATSGAKLPELIKSNLTYSGGEAGRTQSQQQWERKEKGNLLEGARKEFVLQTKDDVDAIAAAQTVKRLVDTNNPAWQEAAKTLLARGSGEKGVLSDRDIVRYGGSGGWSQRIQQFFAKASNEGWTPENKQAYIQLADEYESMARKKISDMQNSVADSYSATAQAQGFNVPREQFLLSIAGGSYGVQKPKEKKQAPVGNTPKKGGPVGMRGKLKDKSKDNPKDRGGPDENVGIYAEQNGLDYNTAEKILKSRGYKGVK